MSEQFEQAFWFECEDVIFMVLMKKKKHVRETNLRLFHFSKPKNNNFVASLVSSIIVLMQQQTLDTASHHQINMKNLYRFSRKLNNASMLNMV